MGVKHSFLKYWDLSVYGDYSEAIKNFYKILREAEETDRAEAILIADLPWYNAMITYDKDNQQGAIHINALLDRIVRASEDRLI